MSAYTVSVINKRIAETISYDPLLSDVSVIGEISNLNYHYSGHVYFTIKDNESQLKCILFKSYAEKVNFILEEGMKVIVRGYINVYQKGGSYSLNAKEIVLSDKKGDLAIAFEIMKDKLNKEGLFDISHKKELPYFPDKIGIITSNTGAAVEDIKRIILEKNNHVDICVFPTKVQGEGAKEDISSCIEYVNKNHKDIDVLIVGRGGGSQEDLWAFNEEIVARAIYNSEIPIISSVGHEIDVSISDFVADKSAPTPTAAAEIAVPNTFELCDTIENYKKDLIQNLNNKVKYYEMLLNNYKNTIYSTMIQILEKYEHKIDIFKNSLVDNNPKKILLKGYSIIRNENNHVIKSINDIKNCEKYNVTLSDGSVNIVVNKVE